MGTLLASLSPFLKISCLVQDFGVGLRTVVHHLPSLLNRANFSFRHLSLQYWLLRGKQLNLSFSNRFRRSGQEAVTPHNTDTPPPSGLPRKEKLAVTAMPRFTWSPAGGSSCPQKQHQGPLLLSRACGVVSGSRLLSVTLPEPVILRAVPNSCRSLVLFGGVSFLLSTPASAACLRSSLAERSWHWDQLLGSTAG